MKRVYLNWKGPQGRETVDEFAPEAGQTPQAFRVYVRQMVAEYTLAGMAVYRSSRPCKGWNT
jgi:hypothetical protein